MTFANLIAHLAWPDVLAALLRLYPDEKKSLEGYRVVLAHLKQLDPEMSKMRIIVEERFQPEIDEAPHIDVTGRDGTLNRELEDFKHFQDEVDEEYASAEADFSLSFLPWAKWLGMQINPATLEEFSQPDIAAHCLWEMTFHGFEESDVEETRAEIEQRAAEVDAMTEEEREKFLIPAEEVFKDHKSKRDSEEQ